MYLNHKTRYIRRGLIILASLLPILNGCQTKNENPGESEEINQTPSLEEARGPLPDTVHLETEDFVYIPPNVIVSPGQEVVFVLTNKGYHDHRILFEFPNGEVELEEAIPPGSETNFRVQIPDQEGTYQFYCPEDQHKEQAMQGEIIVKHE